MVKGKSRESFDGFDLYAGLVNITGILGVNPTVKERAAFYGRELTEKETNNPDIEYTGQTDEGDKKVNLLFYLSTDHPVQKVLPYRIELVNKERRDKAGVKFQVINQTGDTTYVLPLENDDTKPDLSDVPEWFTHFQDKDKNNIAEKKVRIALVGEEQLMTLLKAAFNLDFRDPDTEIAYDYSKFFKGNVSELNSDVKSPELRKMFVAGVEVTKSKEGDKYYQNIYGKKFLPGGILKFIANRNFPGDFLRNQWKKWTEDVEGEYGSKGYLPYEKLSIYDPETDEVNVNTKTEGKTVSSKYD